MSRYHPSRIVRGINRIIPATTGHIPGSFSSTNDKASEQFQQHLPVFLKHHNVKGIQIGSVYATLPEECRRIGTLQRSKPEYFLAVVPQNKLHSPIAESTNSVVEQDRVLHGVNSITWDFGRKHRQSSL